MLKVGLGGRVGRLVIEMTRPESVKWRGNEFLHGFGDCVGHMVAGGSKYGEESMAWDRGREGASRAIAHMRFCGEIERG
jgi:hypothetical protein